MNPIPNIMKIINKTHNIIKAKLDIIISGMVAGMEVLELIINPKLHPISVFLFTYKWKNKNSFTTIPE